MEIKEFINKLKSAHFFLKVDDGKLILQGDKNKLSENEIKSIRSDVETIQFIKDNKEDIINYLSNITGSDGDKRNRNIESIYPLSGLQQGMLFHGLYDQEAGAYINQFRCDLILPDLNAFEKSWDQILLKHSILRSGFFHDDFSVPMQCVFKDVKIPINIQDLSKFSQKEQESALTAFELEDQRQPFDFKKPPLMRISLIKISEERYRLYWTAHHLLFDGWSKQVLMEDLLKTYESIVNNKPIGAELVDKFEDYIRYLDKIDKVSEKQYWTKYFGDTEQGTLLPFVSGTLDRNSGKGQFKSENLELTTEFSEKIEEYAKKNRITVNTLMQGVWSLLLSQYSSNKDIVFGVIVIHQISMRYHYSFWLSGRT